MRATPFFLIAFALLAGACGTTNALDPYQYDLVRMVHNTENGYTLLVYEDGIGEARHVLRNEGVCEIIITYSAEGKITLKERGRHLRTIDSYQAKILSDQINALLATDSPHQAKVEIST